MACCDSIVQPDFPRLYWLMVSSRDAGSSRIHGYRVHEHLSALGWPSEILFGPRHWIYDPPLTGSDFRNAGIFRPGDIVLFQKVRGECTVSMLEYLRDAGVATVYVDADAPLKLDEARLATRVVCASRRLAAEYRDAGVETAAFIPEAWEYTASPKPAFDRRCVWFGTAPGYQDVDHVRSALASAGWELTTISDHPEADIPWSLDDCWDHIRAADAAVLPVIGNDPRRAAKSANRAIQAMALGLVVLTSPTPAYSNVIHDSRNGFLCRGELDWGAALQLLQLPDERMRMAQTGYRYARRFYSMDRVSAMWAEMLRSLAGAPPEAVPEDERQQVTKGLRSLAYNRVADALVKSSAIERAYRAMADREESVAVS